MAQFARAAHNLKGVLRTMGQAGLAERAVQLEPLAAAQIDGDRDFLLQKLWDGVKRFVKYHNQEGVNLEQE